MIGSVWTFITSSNGLLQAIIIAAISAIIARLVTPKGRLVWSTSHQHYYSMRNLEGGSFPVRTQQLWFQNVGRAPIEDVELVLNWEPQHFEVWNPRGYSKSKLDDGRLVLTFPYLSANEHFTLSMLDTIGDLPIVLSARSKSGLGKEVIMAPMRVMPKWMLFAMLGLMLFGFGSLMWFAVQPFVGVTAASGT
ncbi:hypothetical protein [Devosia sp. XK-2]|uniref:hypothetical protein n=1 Tax=Devosia sp. XK-2 TaxID=3126689 RepID=UPI0030D02005